MIDLVWRVTLRIAKGRILYEELYTPLLNNGGTRNLKLREGRG